MEEIAEKGLENQEFEFGGIFDMKTEDFEEKQSESSFNTDFYAPRLDLDTVKNKTYIARGRFVPNVFSGKERLDRVRKYTYYIPDPDNAGKKFYIDAPCNEPKAKDIVTNAYMMLVYEKSKTFIKDVPVQIMKSCKVLKRNTYNYSLFQIMIDDQQPEMVGKIKIFRYGKGVNDKVDSLIKGDPKLGRAGIIPFDPFKGKDFLLKIVEGVNSEGGTTYDYEPSYFDDGIISMSLDGGKTRVSSDNTGKMAIYNFLKENSPKLDQVVFKPLTEQEEDKLIRAVRMVINDDYYFNQVYYQTYGKQFVEPSVSTETITNAQQFAAAQPAQQIIKPQVIQPAATTEQPAAQTVDSATAKFRSLKDNATAAAQPATSAAQSPTIQPVAEAQPTPAVATAQSPTIQPVANPGISGMDVETLLGDMNVDDIE